MSINTKTIQFKEELTLLINNSNLPAVNVLIVLENLQKDVQNLVFQQIQQEKEKEYKGE